MQTMPHCILEPYLSLGITDIISNLEQGEKEDTPGYTELVASLLMQV
jgi:hypothetical protein